MEQRGAPPVYPLEYSVGEFQFSKVVLVTEVCFLIQFFQARLPLSFLNPLALIIHTKTQI